MEKAPATKWQELVQDVSAAANHLVAGIEQIIAYNDWDVVPDERVAISDQLANMGLVELARKIVPAPDSVRDFERFDDAYVAYPKGVLGGTLTASSEVVGELRAAKGAVLKTSPRCRLELGRKVKVGCIVGLHNKIRNACPRPDPYAVHLYNHFWSQLSEIEPWFLAERVGYYPWPGECEFGFRGGNFIVSPGFIEELLECAGPEWQAAIAADVAALERARAIADGEAVLR